MKNSILVPFALFLLFACGSDTDLTKEVLQPSKVELIFPKNNSECTEGLIISNIESVVTFEWNKALTGDYYNLQLINLGNGEYMDFITKSNTLPITLARGTPYQWSVTTLMNDSDNTATSDAASFYNAGPGIQSYIPFPAATISPVNNEVFPSSTSTISLAWQGTDLDNDIVSYDLFFGTINPPNLYLAEITSSSLENIDVETNNEYFWMIITKDANGNESNSDLFSFTIE